MKHQIWDLGQLLTAGIMLSGVCLEIIYRAEIYWIVITFSSFCGFLIEKFKPKGEE